MYQHKYLKYKRKYLRLKLQLQMEQKGGDNEWILLHGVRKPEDLIKILKSQRLIPSMLKGTQSSRDEIQKSARNTIATLLNNPTESANELDLRGMVNWFEVYSPSKANMKYDINKYDMVKDTSYLSSIRLVLKVDPTKYHDEFYGFKFDKTGYIIGSTKEELLNYPRIKEYEEKDPGTIKKYQGMWAFYDRGKLIGTQPTRTNDPYDVAVTPYIIGLKDKIIGIHIKKDVFEELIKNEEFRGLYGVYKNVICVQ
jgi:hypothetical protein